MEDVSALIRQFQRDGFVAARGLLDVDEVRAFARFVDPAVAARKARDTRALAEKTPYEQSFIQCMYLWEDFPDVAGLTFHQKVTGLAAALLGAERIRLFHDQALYKEAGGRETDTHIDHAYWPIVERDAITAWIPLMDVDDETGCMGYAPGTHHGEREFIDIFRTPGAGKILEDRVVGKFSFVHARAGDVLFHHGHTAHKAKPNISDRTRRVYTAIYFRDGCTRAPGMRHPAVDRDRIAEGAVIDGAATPIAYPLKPDALPQAAPWPDASNEFIRRAREMGVFPRALE